MDHVIRPVRADEWRKAKELRLAGLKDPAAPVAFLETIEQANAYPDSFWQERTASASSGTGARQFVAEGPDGTWAGAVVVLVEQAGNVDFFGVDIEAAQGHVVGVFVRAEFRGIGLTERLFESALEWAWSLEEPRLERVRLYVHNQNERAEGFYRKFGFVRTGKTAPGPAGLPDTHEVEMEFLRP
ncbi:GNAT family N-acetyltransferase [Streptomyces melanogenes]|uniref:GNAT family N-acetyltransferase n=1 Tax=Streptomyces melanogenes TaxID=67326 RepID=A0ABZ1XNI3_9ACTN|nr:GNAT family N-acetyltransferase [Streptomyces melanogenes]